MPARWAEERQPPFLSSPLKKSETRRFVHSQTAILRAATCEAAACGEILLCSTLSDMPLLEAYGFVSKWLAKRIHGPMPDTSHLSEKQRIQFENALFDRTPPWFWATLGIG